ncbi:hypothetical protein KCP69_16425 [Salmonella enterica subsp. enterica]|nr:hypothetical protein KCP69_16425 [Salmonella enterica subsp. enterica]
MIEAVSYSTVQWTSSMYAIQSAMIFTRFYSPWCSLFCWRFLWGSVFPRRR